MNPENYETVTSDASFVGREGVSDGESFVRNSLYVEGKAGDLDLPASVDKGD